MQQETLKMLKILKIDDFPNGGYVPEEVLDEAEVLGKSAAHTGE